MTRTRRRIVLAAALLGVAALAGNLVRPRPIEVQVAVVERAPFRTTIDAEGRTRVRDRYVIAAPVTGRLERLEVRIGDRVAPGTVLARLAPLPLDATTETQAHARLAAAEALEREAATRLAQARVAAVHTRRTSERYRALEAAGGISQQQLDQAELASRTSDEEVSAAEARVRAAAAEVGSARATLLGSAQPAGDARMTVRSPVQGQVLKVPEASERVIAAGAPILEVGDPGSVEVVLEVLSSDAVRIAVGAEVLIEDWGGERVLRGCVRQIEPSAAMRVSALGVEEQRVNVVLDLLEPANELGDGYRVEARILVWEGANVLSVPSSAVFRTGSEWRVFVVRDGRIREQAIEVGHRSDAAVEVLRGLEERSNVVLFPSDEIRQGVRVKIRRNGRDGT